MLCNNGNGNKIQNREDTCRPLMFKDS